MADEDPYVYPGTTVLRNHFGIRDPKKLAAVEMDIVGTRFRELLVAGVPGEFTPAWHKSVHAALFGELYPFAGHYRTVHMAKIGEAPYANPTFLEANAQTIFADLAKRNSLRGLSPTAFREQLVRVMADLHVLHAFREGNTRTLQIATAEIASRAGHRLEWNRADPKILREAGTHAAFGNYLPYTRILQSLMPSDDRRAFAEQAKAAIRATRTTILTSAIHEQAAGAGMTIRGRVIAVNERYVALATTAHSFAVLEHGQLSENVAIGEDVRVRVGECKIVIETRTRGHHGRQRGR